jgi:uncharacterized membrane protein
LTAELPQADRFDRLEARLGRLLFAGTAACAILLAVGVALWMLGWRGPATGAFLHAGLIVLLATPVARVVVSCCGYLRQREWFLVAMTLAVLAVLLTAVVLAVRTVMAR